MRAPAAVLAAAVAFALPLAACGPRDVAADGAAFERGRNERAFWDRYDAARDALAAGDAVSAETEFRAVLALRPDHAASLYALAGILHRSARHDEALALVGRLERVDRPRTRALLLRAAIRSDVEALCAEGRSDAPWFDLDDAARAVGEAEASNPEETGPHLMRGRVEILRGHLAAADAALGRTLTIHPGHAEALVLRSVVLRARGDDAGAREALAAALAASAPKETRLPAGEGDTTASLDAARRSGTPRLRALAEVLAHGDVPWPADAPAPPPRFALPGTLPPAGADPLRAAVDLDGDGVAELLVARRAPEGEALLSLFGVRREGGGSFVVRRRGEDVTAASGLAGVAACVGSLHVADQDGDGDLDVVVLPGRGDPSRREPPLVLRNDGAGRLAVFAAH